MVSNSAPDLPAHPVTPVAGAQRARQSVPHVSASVMPRRAALMFLFALTAVAHCWAQERPPVLGVHPGWEYRPSLCLHALCGEFVDSSSATVVEFSIRNWELAWHLCELPGAPSVQLGYSGSIPVCLLEVTNAREWEIVNYLASHPEVTLTSKEFERTQFSPPGTAVVHVQFLAPGGVLYLWADVCDPAQRSRALSLMLAHLRLSPEAS